MYRCRKLIYKYPNDNLKLQVNDKWDVHCPICNKTANYWVTLTSEKVSKRTLRKKLKQ